ncbi:MAG: TraR/DksA family transcriptional regulator [Candidatus Rokubacteria bacterium]|nr:TraR/DksA family transcriptional regulator [Candidatus Rokubacteria bacterium]
MKEIQAQLEQELHQTVERLRQLGGAIVIEDFASPVWDDASFSDAVDGIQINEDREISLATRSLLVERANKLAEAIERLRRGVYGRCEECDEPIAPARLKAMPEVTTCVRCQDRIERELRRSNRVAALFAAAEEDDE